MQRLLVFSLHAYIQYFRWCMIVTYCVTEYIPVTYMNEYHTFQYRRHIRLFVYVGPITRPPVFTLGRVKLNILMCQSCECILWSILHIYYINERSINIWKVLE